MKETADGWAEGQGRLSLLGYVELPGGAPGAQVMVGAGYAYVGHLLGGGFSIIDVRDPRRPTIASQQASSPQTWNGHMQLHNELLLVVDEYVGSAIPGLSKEPASAPWPERDFASGLTVYDVHDPLRPRAVGRLAVPGLGLHRIWYVGEEYAYASAALDGFSGHILAVIDMRVPFRPVIAGKWWLPGMWTAGGEAGDWGPGFRVALHHCIVANGIGYGAWRDGGFTILDLRNPERPKLIAHRGLDSPHGHGTHTTLPLTERVPEPRSLMVVAEEGNQLPNSGESQRNWLIDVSEPSEPVSLSVLPTPAECAFDRLDGSFGPHNLHENRPGSFQSSHLIFGTYQNAGVRVWDISDTNDPVQVAAYPSGPPGNFDLLAPGHSLDLFVDKQRHVYVSDLKAGFKILEFT
jgi:hypothetical protein